MTQNGSWPITLFVKSWKYSNIRKMVFSLLDVTQNAESSFLGKGTQKHSQSMLSSWIGNHSVYSRLFPFALILKVLKKIMTDRATSIVIVPHWTSQPWFPLFSKLLIQKPLLFKPSLTLVLSPCRSIQHPLAKKLSLMVGKLSGNLSKREVCPTL